MSSYIFFHTVTCLIALAVGGIILSLKKGDRVHRFLGWIFVVSMGAGTLSSFGILDHGSFSFLHILSIQASYSLAKGLWMVKKKPNNWLFRHAEAMCGACLALLIAGFGVLGRHVFQNSGVSWWWFLSFGFLVGTTVYSMAMRMLRKRLL